MSNHFHLAIEALKVSELSSYIGRVCERYTKYFHRKYNGSGPLWRGRYKSKVVQKEGYLNRLARYIERNPVRAGLNITRPDEYQWSSASCYMKGIDDQLVGVADHPFWSSMGIDVEQRCDTYKRFLLTEQEALEDEKLFRGSKTVIGDKEFQLKLTTFMGRKTARKVGRPRGLSVPGTTLPGSRNDAQAPT